MHRGFDLQSFIQQDDTLIDSNYSSLSHQEHQLNWFIDQRSYIKQILSAWGMSIGDLPHSTDNQTTLRCLLELIRQRQRDLEFRTKAKEDMNALSFEKEKYRSYMEQAQRSLEDHLKRMGRLQNENSDLKAKASRGEAQNKKERDQDKRMIAMLRSKNEQIQHQIKKKEQEVHRVREQMKKSVGEKGAVYKNSFDVFAAIQGSPLKSTPEEAKFSYLMERNQRELADALNENGLLREKVYSIREELVRFGQWVDQQIFGEKNSSNPNRFFINHRLMMKQGSLTEQLNQLMEVTKDGILQLRAAFRSTSPTALAALTINRETKDSGGCFKKKGRSPPKTERLMKQAQTPVRYKARTRKRNEREKEEVVSPRPSNQQRQERVGTPQKTKIGRISDKQGNLGMMPEAVYHSEDNPFGEEMISEVGHEDDCSIVSHISVEQIGKSRFDKWDMLYDEQ